MALDPPSPANWSSAFSVWIRDIEVQFQPVEDVRRITGGFLRQVRRISHYSAPLLALLFSLHCTRPGIQTSRHAGPLEPGAGAGEVFTESGQASWYGGDGDGFAGKATASGEPMDPEALTCAHRTLPLGTLVEVENIDNGRRATLRVNDRGPFARNRVLDVSRKGAKELGFLGQGTATVRFRTVGADGRPAPVDGRANEKNPFTIQVAALADPINIERLTRELGEQFGPVTYQEATTRGGKLVKRVRVGTYTTLKDAEKAAEELARRFKDRGVDPFITRRR